MAKNLVIVESPSKAKTIAKFLGSDYQVMSSYGHIRDLHKKDFSIDLEHDFMPIYEIPSDKKDVVKQLKAAASEAEMVWLASDEDREGEAIAWHLYEVLGLTPSNTRRIVFHEITKPAILAAISNPRQIDLNLVDAQQARRVLDRIVGFELSPVLWKKIKKGLSAGRVQSVAVRLIVEREKEIRAFQSETYYRVVAQFMVDGTPVNAELQRRLASAEEAEEVLNDCKNAIFSVTDIVTKPQHKYPAAPFTTSTLQQEASRKLGLSVSQTMRLAQNLYENGHITYMRTDSVNLSSLAINTISKEIKEKFGERYLKVRKYHTTAKGAQEAHEAIRPTFVDRDDVAGTAQERRLYKLIRRRAIASQMADAETEKTTVEIAMSNRSDRFVAVGEVVKFDGFLSVYHESSDDERHSDDATQLPPIGKGDELTAASVEATQRYTQQPPRYTEATLVKKMEELGIGRPSTYAPTISTIQNREYVGKGESTGTERSCEVITLKGGKITHKTKTEMAGAEKGKLLPTDTGVVVNDFLLAHFDNIMDYNFTAKIESEFDEIAEGNRRWNEEIKSFYQEFQPKVNEVSQMRLEHKVGERTLGIDPATGKRVSVKIGRFGPVVQIGETSQDEKPRFAALQKNQSIEMITLEEALKLFELPRNLGEIAGETVTVAVGRFGPYVKVGSRFVSIPKGKSPMEITLEEAQQLLEEKRDADAKKVVKTFADNADMQILNGRYGVYICYKKANYKIPKGVNADELTLEQCLEIVASAADAPAKKPGTRRRVATAKKK